MGCYTQYNITNPSSMPNTVNKIQLHLPKIQQTEIQELLLGIASFLNYDFKLDNTCNLTQMLVLTEQLNKYISSSRYRYVYS